MDKINEILAELTLIKGKGNQSVVANALGIKPQTFGNYLKGREVPVSLIIQWRKVYGEDLLALALDGDGKETRPEMTVSKNNNEEKQQSFQARIFNGDYIGMHKRAYDRLDESLAVNHQLLLDTSATNKNLSESVMELTKNLNRSRGNKQR